MPRAAVRFFIFEISLYIAENKLVGETGRDGPETALPVAHDCAQ